MEFCRGILQGDYTTDKPLKKDKRWHWTEKCRATFEDLKRRMVTQSILRLLDFERPFEVHTDAFDFAIGGVLL